MSTYRLDTGSVADWQITQRLGGNCVRIESPTLLTHMIVRLSDLIATGVPSGPVAGGGGQVEATPSAGALPAAIVPAARATDPATSHEAAATITVQRMRTVHQPWCKRFNNAGIEAIDKLVLDLTNSAIHLGKNDPTRPKLPGCQYNAGDRIQACIDERYGIVVAYEFWSEWTS